MPKYLESHARHNHEFELSIDDIHLLKLAEFDNDAEVTQFLNDNYRAVRDLYLARFRSFCMLKGVRP